MTRRLPTTKAAPERRAPGPGTLTCVSHGGRDMGCRFPAGPDRPRPAAADSMRRRIMQRRRRSRRRWRRCSSSSCRSSCWRSSSSCSSRRAPPLSAPFSAIGALQERHSTTRIRPQPGLESSAEAGRQESTHHLDCWRNLLQNPDMHVGTYLGGLTYLVCQIPVEILILS